MVLLHVQQLSKSFPIEGGVLRRRVGSVEALRDISLEVAQGETVALVGGSGSGKSTLARIVAGLLPPDSGRILWNGRTLSDLTRLERARSIQMIFQDPYASLNPKLSIRTQLEEVLRLGSVQQGRTAAHLLDTVGLSADTLAHYPFQFSGGQRQRIAIARALAMQPALLVADEPLSALDVTIQSQILELLKQLKATYGLTLLFITHDLAVVDRFADRVIVLQDGKIVESGLTGSVLNRPQHAYTQALLAAVPRVPS
jgi:ABC-type glutathione transport system ATPase component